MKFLHLPPFRWLAAVSVCALMLAGCGQDTPISLGSTPDPISTVISMRAQPTPLATDEQVLLSQEPNATAGLPPCAPSIPVGVTLPETFAPGFPFPENIAFAETTALNDNPNYLQVIGYASMDLQTAIQRVITTLPEAGYKLGTGDSEATEMETLFSGRGYRGGLRVASMPTCEQVTQWTVVVFKQ